MGISVMSINWVVNCSNNSVLYIISMMSPGSMMSWSMSINGIFNIISVMSVGSMMHWTNYSVVGSKDGILLDVISMDSMSSMSVVIMSVD